MERWVVWQRYNIPPVIRVRFPPLPSPPFQGGRPIQPLKLLSARGFDLAEIPPTFRASQSERVNFRDETCGSRTS